tara:strand:+ start:2499 stop:2909 length:411 start_codon:yes stop_codon:yes gene_type:complete
MHQEQGGINMKHKFKDNSYQFPTLKNNSFQLHDIDRNIWRFNQTSFHVRGTPSEVFKYTNLKTLDHLSCCLAILEIKILDADGLLMLISDITNDIKFQNDLTRLSSDFSDFRKVLDHYSASISEGTIQQYIKDNDL